MTTDLAGFEARAAEAERRLAALEAQVLGGAAAGGAAAGGERSCLPGGSSGRAGFGGCRRRRLPGSRSLTAPVPPPCAGSTHTHARGPGSHATSAGLAGEDLAATLEGLYKVRILMGKAAHEKAALERENAALKAANARLETDTGRMKYQILHLKRNLVAAQGGGA